MTDSSTHAPKARKAASERLKNRIWPLVILLGLATIPMIYASLLTSSFSDPQSRFENIPAAVVNADEAATLDGNHLDLGAELTEELLTSTESNNFSWQELSAQDAAKALERGDVYAVLSIPSDFSANALSVAGDDPLPARLSIATNDGANMFVGTIAKQIGTVVADSLASSVSAEYLSNIYAGFNTAHDGFTDAADGAVRLSEGAGDASDGASELNIGLGQLVTGTGDLSTATSQLVDGAQQLNSGAATLNDGGAALHDGAADLAAGASDVNDGAQQLRDGAGQVADGTQQLADTVDAVSESVSPLADSVGTFAEDAGTLTGGAEDISTGLENLVTNWESLSDADKQQLVQQLAGDASAVRDGLDGALSGLDSLDLGGLDALDDLSSSVHTLNDGAQQVASGAGDLVDGTSTLATGADTLADKSGELADGIATLVDGTSTLYDGAVELHDGAVRLQDGTVTAADGSASLADGLTQLVDGSEDLATGLEDGAGEVPTYSDSESERLSEVASDPVQIEETRLNEVATNGAGMAPYFMSLGLWVGGMGFYLMKEPLARATGRGLAVVDALRSYLPGALMALAQTALLFVTIHYAVGVEFANPLGLVGLMLLASLTFVAINQALIALLGAPGRYIALILVVLQLSSAGATYPVQTTPAFFQIVNPWLPLTHAVDGFRSLIAGGAIGVTEAVWYLLVWLAAALVATTLAIMLQRIREQSIREQRLPGGGKSNRGAASQPRPEPATAGKTN
ncbi:YhgE/Pip domain-containing protein [Gulosibacter chungangensis]|uniref:YhgE/Pip domain-containing protein n=1 Tax=Gulosibacter chungangensis TaxID=979746 RepID=A0A7J5BAE2_9MICO|nr:YhgE/Pip domain-containing protein [Gulosibacter chungangensis]KAB1643079.1 YhgE/Pip domain-containing protein [Gulosibacter chungangensis]